MNLTDDEDERSNTGAGQSVPAPERRIAVINHRIDSQELFVGTREIAIAHGGDMYRLRLTAQNKLILTK